MTATLQQNVTFQHFLLVVYCPVCQSVVEAQMLWCSARFYSENIWSHSLSPDVALREAGSVYLWTHGTCGGTMVEVLRTPTA